MNPMQSSNVGTSGAANLPVSLLPVTVQELPALEAPVAQMAPSAEQRRADRDQLVVEHMPMVRFIARRIHERLPQHIELEDLVSAGVLGLIDAVSKFDQTRDVQLKSYAQFRVRGAILDSLREMDWGPRDLRRKARAIEGAIRVLSSQLGRSPSEAEIADELGLTLMAYQQLLGEVKGLEIGTLHNERNEDSGEEELAYVPGPASDDPLFRCMQSEMRGRLVAAIEALPERERLVLTLYYFEELTMKEIAMTLEVVESRISQIHSSAVLHLRSALAAGPATAESKERPKRAGSCAARRVGFLQKCEKNSRSPNVPPLSADVGKSEVGHGVFRDRRL